MHLAGDYENIGARSLRRVSKPNDTIATRPFSDTFRTLLTIYGGRLTSMNLMNWYSLYKCAGGLGSTFLIKAYQHVLAGGLVPAQFAASGTVFIPKSYDVGNNGFIVRSPDALRQLTLCNSDCRILTTAICRGLHWYTMRCIHPSQRCISPSQMTDNINDCLGACGVRPSRVRQSFGGLYRCVLQHQPFLELPEFTWRFLRMICCNSTTQVEFAGKARRLTRLSGEWLLVCNCVRSHLSLAA